MEEFESNLIGTIYDAALEPERWQLALEAIRNASAADEVSLIFYDALNRVRNSVFSAVASDEANIQFVREFIDIEMQGALDLFRSIPDGQLVSDQEITALRGNPYEKHIGEASEFHEAMNISARAGMRLIHSNHVSSILGVHRKPGLPALSNATMGLLRRLAPHLIRAVRIHNQLSATRYQNERLLDTLKHASAGILLLDADLRVVFSNPEAARVIDKHPALSIGRFGRLCTPLPSQQQKLQQLLEQIAARIVTRADGLSLALHHELRLQPLKLTALSLASAGMTAALAAEKICIAVFVSDPDRSWSIPAEYLKQAYGLTVTECVIAESLLNGANISDIAHQRGTTQNTARWQLKCLLQKTHSRNQAELVRLLMALSSDLSLPI